MSTENIVITVTETGARQVARNIDSIGTSSKKSQDAISSMLKTLNQLNAASNALKSTESSMAKLNTQMAKNAQIQAQVDIAASKSALAQQRLATETQRTQLMMAKVEAQLNRTIAAEDRAAISGQNLARAQMAASTQGQRFVTEQQRTAKAAADAAAAMNKEATAAQQLAAAQAKAQQAVAAGANAQVKAQADIAAAQSRANAAAAQSQAATQRAVTEQQRTAQAAAQAATAQAVGQSRAAAAAAQVGTAQQKAAQATAQAAAAGDRAAISALKLEAAQRRAADAAARHSGSLDTLKGSLIAAAGALGIRSILDMADSWIAAEGKVNIFTHSATETTMVMDRLFEIAQKTRQPIDGIASSFHQLSIAGSALGASQNQLLQFTQAVGNALAIQGTDSNTARGGIIQLGQAMNEGIVRAQEYNSMINAMPIVLKTVANNLDGAGGSLAKLRQMMLAGKLTSKDFFQALLKGQGDLEKLFDRSGKTFGQAFTVIQNGLKRYIGQMNEASGASRLFYDGAKLVAGNIDTIVKSMIALAAPRILLGLKAITMQLWAMATAAAANPYVTLAAALVSVVAALVLFKDDLVIVRQGMDDCSILAITLGDYMSAAWGLAKDGMTAVSGYLNEKMLPAWNELISEIGVVGEVFNTLPALLANKINTMIGTFIGFGKSIGIVLAGIAPAFRDAMVNAGNEMIGTLEGTINKAISLTNSMRDKVGLDPYANVEIGRIQNPDAGKAKELGTAVKDAFTESVNFDYIGSATAAVGGALDELTKRAKENAIQRQKLLAEDEKLRKEIDLDKPNGDGEDFAGNKKLTAAEKAMERARISLAKWVGEQQAATDASNGMAAAYMAGGDAVSKYSREEEIGTQVAKRGEAARKDVTKAVNDHQDALERLDLAKNIDDVRKQITDMNAQTQIQLLNNQSLEKGTAAQDQYTVSKQLAVAMAGKNAEGLAKESDELEHQLSLLQEATNRQKATAEIAGLIDSTSNAQETFNRKLEHFKQLNAYATTPEEIEAIRRATVQAQNETSIFAKITEGAIDRMDSAWADMWKSVFSGTGDTLSKMGDAIKQWLAEMAHMLLTKPLMVSIGNYLTGSNNSGGIGDVISQFTGSSGGSGGLMGMIGSIKNVASVAGSKFGEAIMSGWSGGDGVVGGLQGAFSNGADYVQSAISSAFSTGSAVAAANVSQSATAALSASYSGYAAQFGTGVSQGSFSAAAASAGSATSALATLSSVLGYIQGVYTIFNSFKSYGIKGAAVTGGMAAAGAYIGSFAGPIGTAAGFAIGATLGALGAGKLFSSGEKYPDLSTSATGNYQNGQYTDTGIATSWQRKAPKYGAAMDSAMGANLNKFTTTLGMLYETLGNGAPVASYNTMQVRKTSGKYSTTFGTQLDDGTAISAKQQFSAKDAATALAENYDNVMGTFLAQAIVKSKSLPEYFKAQFTAFADDWNTTADQVIKAIEGVFTRFNGVNAALASINVGTLKLDNAGLIASDSILDLVGSINGLDLETATAKEKVDSLNQSVQAYYSKFFTQAEQLADLTKTLQDSFGNFGMKLPDTRQDYRKIVESIDVTTSAGQAMFATFMGLATAADQYYATLEQAAADAQEAAQKAAEAAAAAWANYYDLFATDSQKAADTLALANREFASLGLIMPATRAGFVDMVNSIDQTTAAGKSLFGSLIGMATDADAAYKVVEQQAADALAAQTAAAEAAAALQQTLNDALMKGATDSLSALQRAITAQQDALTKAYNAQTEALNTALDTAKTNVSDLTSVSNDLGSALKSLRGNSAAAVAMMRRQAVATLQSALTTARGGGSLANFAGLSDALDTVANNTTDQYKTLADFNRDQGRTAGIVAELEALNGKQLTSAEKTVASLEAQLDQSKKAFDAQMAALDAQLATGQAQLDALNGIDNSVISVAQAVANMNTAISKALSATNLSDPKSNTYDNNVALIKSIYQEVLGRDLDGNGLKTWTEGLANGTVTYATLLKMITEGGKANGETVRPGYANGGRVLGAGSSTSDSIRANLSNGEYVMHADAVSKYGVALLDQMNYGGTSATTPGTNYSHDDDDDTSMFEVIMELKALNKRLDMIEANTSTSAVNGNKLNRTIDRLTDGGNAMHVTLDGETA